MPELHRSALRGFTLAVLTLSLTLVATPAVHADDTFFESDDYQEGEEIKNVFLQDADYRIMIEDLERNGQDFDWGWALTPGWQGLDAAPASEPEGGGRFRRGGGNRGPKLVQEPKELGFDVRSFGSISISEVENFSGLMSPDELAEVRQAFVLGFEQLGLQVVAAGAPADLDLDLALVDINREGGGFGWIQVDPFIELELRLRDTAGDRDLMLIRNQEHGDDPEAAALQYANQLVIFLR
jgi:hypothetical protein